MTKKLMVCILCVLFSMLPVIPVNAAEAKDTWICEEYQKYIMEISEQYGICPELIMAIVERESSGQADVEAGGCKGLMQVSDRWHRDRMERLGVTDIYDPYGNILVGTDYLAELRDEYGDLPMVLMKYNGSSDARSRWESGEYTEYATEIMARAEELEMLHENEHKEEGKKMSENKEMQTLYVNCRPFRDYVDKYCRTYRVTRDEAMDHMLVKAVARQYAEKDAEEEQNGTKEKNIGGPIHSRSHC